MPALASSWALSHKVKGLGSIPGQGTCLSCGFGHQSGCVQQATDQCFSHNLLSLSFFLPSPLSGINEKKRIKSSHSQIIPKKQKREYFQTHLMRPALP